MCVCLCFFFFFYYYSVCVWCLKIPGAVTIFPIWDASLWLFFSLPCFTKIFVYLGECSACECIQMIVMHADVFIHVSIYIYISIYLHIFIHLRCLLKDLTSCVNGDFASCGLINGCYWFGLFVYRNFYFWSTSGRSAFFFFLSFFFFFLCNFEKIKLKGTAPPAWISPTCVQTTPHWHPAFRTLWTRQASPSVIGTQVCL
jgi:hypothetical protein